MNGSHSELEHSGGDAMEDGNEEEDFEHPDVNGVDDKDVGDLDRKVEAINSNTITDSTKASYSSQQGQFLLYVAQDHPETLAECS